MCVKYVINFEAVSATPAIHCSVTMGKIQWHIHHCETVERCPSEKALQGRKERVALSLQTSFKCSIYMCVSV